MESSERLSTISVANIILNKWRLGFWKHLQAHISSVDHHTMDIVRQTMKGLDIPSVLDNLKPPSDPSSHFIFKQIADLISSDVKYCQNGPKLAAPSTVYQKLESYKHFVWEKLNTGHWSQLDDAWRALFTIISLARIICISQVQSPPEIESDVCRDVIKICDLGIMMGAALPGIKNPTL